MAPRLSEQNSIFSVVSSVSLKPFLGIEREREAGIVKTLQS